MSNASFKKRLSRRFYRAADSNQTKYIIKDNTGTSYGESFKQGSDPRPGKESQTYNQIRNGVRGIQNSVTLTYNSTATTITLRFPAVSNDTLADNIARCHYVKLGVIRSLGGRRRSSKLRGMNGRHMYVHGGTKNSTLVGNTFPYTFKGSSGMNANKPSSGRENPVTRRAFSRLADSYLKYNIGPTKAELKAGTLTRDIEALQELSLGSVKHAAAVPENGICGHQFYIGFYFDCGTYIGNAYAMAPFFANENGSLTTTDGNGTADTSGTFRIPARISTETAFTTTITITNSNGKGGTFISPSTFNATNVKVIPIGTSCNRNTGELKYHAAIPTLETTDIFFNSSTGQVTATIQGTYINSATRVISVQMIMVLGPLEDYIYGIGGKYGFDPVSPTIHGEH